MKAAVIHELGSVPVLGDFTDPREKEGQRVGRLLAASLNPLDMVIVAGGMPHRPVAPPFVAGYEGVVELGSGQLAYVAGPPQPYGSLAELMPVPDDLAIPVPAGLDPVLATSLGVSGLAAWLSLEYRGNISPGETVLILGSGAVGLIAVQAAKLLGASTVVLADLRQDALDKARAKGADQTVNVSGKTPEEISEAFASAAPQGFDLILDLVWGDIVNQAIGQANMHARLVQTGNAAGAVSPLAAPVFRNKHISIIGQSVVVAPHAVRRDAYGKLARAALGGSITVETQTMPLDAIESTWMQLSSGASTKLVVVP